VFVNVALANLGKRKLTTNTMLSAVAGKFLFQMVTAPFSHTSVLLSIKPLIFDLQTINHRINLRKVNETTPKYSDGANFKCGRRQYILLFNLEKIKSLVSFF
jgi:hypothetical protein